MPVKEWLGSVVQHPTSPPISPVNGRPPKAPSVFVPANSPFFVDLRRGARDRDYDVHHFTDIGSQFPFGDRRLRLFVEGSGRLSTGEMSNAQLHFSASVHERNAVRFGRARVSVLSSSIFIPVFDSTEEEEARVIERLVGFQVLGLDSPRPQWRFVRLITS